MSLRPVANIIQYTEKHADPDKAQKIIKPLHQIKKTTKPEKTALLIKQAIDEMNTNLSQDTVTEIMNSCGKDCAEYNKRTIEAALKRRRKHSTLQAYLEAEEQTPQKGTRIKIDGDTIILWYTPKEFSHPMRCYCSLQRALPLDQTTNINYCKCSEAFVHTQWERILEHPVEVEVLESAISGSEECKFLIKPI